ncbi:MAG: DNA integrity scanning protein DisA [Candidatus Hydrogenedentes bacterium]|nr:DNA integrity scanning protein DisA [Candidatus Hydrogenedentota bacterium]
MANRKKMNEDERFQEVLKMIAPGTPMREAISAILQSRMGALICIGNPTRLSRHSEGGVKLDAEMTPQLLYELSKMDGPIILNEEATRIVYANRFLKPSDRYPSTETGTRHRIGHRFANQTKCVVLALSRRRSSVTLYCHGRNYVLDSIQTLINKGVQTLQTLEKYVETLRKIMRELTTRELDDAVTIFDICRVLQRGEMVLRIQKEMEPIIVELGVEGRLLQLYLQETVQPLKEVAWVIRDYHRERPGVTEQTVLDRIAALTNEELMNLGCISQALGYGPNPKSVDSYLTPRGFHFLHAINRLPANIIDNLVEQFGSLPEILAAGKDKLVEVDGVGDVMAQRIRSGITLYMNQLGKFGEFL